MTDHLLLPSSDVWWRRSVSAATTAALGVFFYIESAREAATLDQLNCAIVFVSAAVASIAGFAFSPLAGALLLNVQTDTVQVVQIMLVSSIALQAYSTVALRRHIQPQVLVPYLAGGFLAMPMGNYLLLHTPVHHYLAGVGSFLVLYALYGLLLQKSTAIASRWCSRPAKVLVGALGGITGPVAAFPGAFMTIWCGLQGWEKHQQRALYQPYILIMQIAALLTLQTMHAGDTTTPWLIQYVPPALAGAYIGLRVFDLLTTRKFNKVVSLFLLVSGAVLIIKTL